MDGLLTRQSYNPFAELSDLVTTELIAPCALDADQQREGAVSRFRGGNLRDTCLDRALHTVACSQALARLFCEGRAGKLLHLLLIVDFCLTGDSERDREVGRLAADWVIGVLRWMTLRKTCQLLFRAHFPLQARLCLLGKGVALWSCHCLYILPCDDL